MSDPVPSVATERLGNPNAPAQGNPPASQSDWVKGLEGITDEERGKLSRFKTDKDCAKSYLQLESRLGASVVIPGKDATPQDWEAFYKRLGRPETKAEYELEKLFLPDGVTRDEKTEEAFKAIAFELGLTKDQAKRLHKYANEQMIAGVSNLRSAMAARTEESRTALRKEWGGDYERNVAGITTLVRKFGGDDTIQYLNSGPGNDAPLLKFLARITKVLSPDTLETGALPRVTEERQPGVLHYDNRPELTGANRTRSIR